MSCCKGNLSQDCNKAMRVIEQPVTARRQARFKPGTQEPPVK